ncbi:MAG TPA: nucleotidyltransferase domain-containing protein [Thermodesulfovibrio thiophilus]|nr:nucleotidyltransferase domain-containing protein [Thermodesulfovibrio thiophilus]
MINKEAVINTIQDLKRFLEHFFKNKKRKVRVILFGSRARQDNQYFSDIDFAIDSEEDINEDIVELKGIIEESSLPYKVDIIVLSRVSEMMRDEILKEGEVWIDLKN